MNLLKRITSFRKIPINFYIYALFVVLHLFLLNVNVAEWGDSYRILRASEYLRDGSYPQDEKRPPLFSSVLALRPENVDAVLWGRVVMALFSLASLIVFEKITEIFVKDEKYKNLALIFFIFNPVYLYWSIRIMADVPFAFFVLLAFYLLSKWNHVNYKRLLILGAICGLAILTRFEGYLLFAGVTTGVVFKINENRMKLSFSSIFSKVYENKWKVAVLGLTTLVVLLPWLMYRNPLRSSYFEETSGRTYDLKMIWIYFSSLLFSLGFTGAFYFIFSKLNTVSAFIKENVGISTFILIEMFLILLWPAAIPRLFVPIVPFFIILLVMCLKDVSWSEKSGKSTAGFFALLILFFMISQYFLKLQFLMPVKIIFGVLVLIQVLTILFIYLGKKRLFFASMLISSIVWSLSVIYIHKDIYIAIKSASLFAVENLQGKVVYNDTTSTSDWYLNYSGLSNDVQGEKWDFLKKNNLSYNKLLYEDVSYVITTNEDGNEFDRGIENLKHLKLIQSFRYNIGSKEFFAKVFEFER